LVAGVRVAVVLMLAIEVLEAAEAGHLFAPYLTPTRYLSSWTYLLVQRQVSKMRLEAITLDSMRL